MSSKSLNKSTMFVKIDGVQYIVQKGSAKERREAEMRENLQRERAQRKYGCRCAYLYLYEEGYCSYIVGFAKFFLHFLVVIGLLFMGAWVLMELEEPIPVRELKLPTGEVIKAPSGEERIKELWARFENRYNLTLNNSLRSNLLEGFKRRKAEQEGLRQKNLEDQRNHDRYGIFKKWFYFSFIASTTIGYGDVVPVTHDGRLFYIGFSIIGIAAMMTLLGRTGGIISSTNRKLYLVVIRNTCWDSSYISETALSFLTLVVIFLGFLGVVLWYDATLVRPDIPWAPVHVIYFWIMTWTTVGFGSSIDLQRELQYATGLMLCRVIGLAFLASIIDALVVWLKYRQELCEQRARVMIYGPESEEGENDNISECPTCQRHSYIAPSDDQNS